MNGNGKISVWTKYADSDPCMFCEYLDPCVSEGTGRYNPIEGWCQLPEGHCPRDEKSRAILVRHLDTLDQESPVAKALLELLRLS